MHAYSQVTFMQPGTAAYLVAGSVAFVAHLQRYTVYLFRLGSLFKLFFFFPAAILPAAGLGQQAQCVPNIPAVCADPCRVGGKVWCLISPEKKKEGKEKIKEKGEGFVKDSAKVGNVPLLCA